MNYVVILVIMETRYTDETAQVENNNVVILVIMETRYTK